jgi:hypothetical protein
MKYKIIAIGNRDSWHGWKSMIGKTGIWKQSEFGNSQEGYQCGTFTFDDKPKKLRNADVFFFAVKVEPVL